MTRISVARRRGRTARKKGAGPGACARAGAPSTSSPVQVVAGNGVSHSWVTMQCTNKVVDAMVTNFHLPESTLLTLVCAFSGYERIMAAYRHAVQQQYRFFSYGDAMFLERSP